MNRFQSNLQSKVSRALVILLLALSPVACGEAPLPTIPAFEELGFENALDVVRQQMLKYYERVQVEPQNAQRNGYFGMLLAAYDKNAAASIFFQRARILESENFDWAYYLATSAKQLGRYQEAADMFREALMIEPGNIEARIQLADVLFEINEIDESIKLYELITAELPERIDAWLGLGKAYDRSGDYNSAITALRRAKNLGVQYGDIRYALAGALGASGDKEGAAREFSAYEKRSKNKINIPNKYVRAVIRLNASDGPFLAKADYQIGRGQFKEAVGFFRSALEINPNNQDAWGGLIYAQGRLGKFDDTTQSYEAALAAGIRYKRLHFTYAEALRKWQKFEEARIVMGKAIELDPSYTEALLAMGELELKLGAPDAAVVQFSRAAAVVPNDRNIRMTLVSALNAAGQYEQAITELEPLNDDPSVSKAVLLMERAIAYHGLGRNEEALDTLRQGKMAAVEAYDISTEEMIDRLLANW